MGQEDEVDENPASSNRLFSCTFNSASTLGGWPLRTLYAFDPRIAAILLIGGDKTGNDRWYETYVPKADLLYDEHLQQLRREGLIDG